MSTKYSVNVDIGKRTVFVRMKGVFNDIDMRKWSEIYRQATSPLAGKKHMIIADMRGMKASHPSVAEIMGAEIGYARRHGVVLCAHISDDTVQRLQAARVCRQNSTGDDVTVDVVSLEEALKVVTEASHLLDDTTPLKSIRMPLAK
ncbi:MAG: hypothetical protein HOW73_16470 [Polyangiaceae bacterium]|nr:hypothetical protein [Polyangiaceae bacterium]